MKRLMPLLLVAAACGGAPIAPDTTSSAAPGLMPGSNVDVVTLPKGSSPVLTLRLLFRAGAADDPEDRAGATALAAQLMVEGGTERLDATAFKAKLFPWAASIDARVDKEMTVFTARVHKDHLAEFVPLLAEVLLHPRWDAQEFERLRRDASDGIAKGLRHNNDEALGQEALNVLLYAGHPYGRPTAGTVSGLAALTVDALRAHAARLFTRGRLTIGVGGGWDEATLDLLRAQLGSLPEGDAPTKPAVAGEGLAGVRVLLVDKDAPAVAVSIGAPIEIDRSHPDFTALMLGMSGFGEHRQFHGRLMRKLRVERGLNYGTYAYAEHFEQDGWSTLAAPNIARSRQYFSIWIRPVKPETAHFAIRTAMYEYSKLLGAGLSDEEVEAAKSFLRGYTRIWQKNAARRVGIALDDAWYGTPERLEKFRAALDAVTPAQVNAALKTHLPPAEKLRYAIVTKNAAAFRDALVAETPSPMTYNSPKEEALLAEDKAIERLVLGLPATAIRIVPVAQMFE